MDLMEKVVSLCKRRGFVFPGSDIYGGLQGFWDYGPLGVEIKNNVKREWWKTIVYEREDVVGLDAAIIMNPQIWEASGHTASFTDPLVECKNCHHRFRIDQVENHCPDCGGELTDQKTFNLLTEVYLGSTEPKQKTYLRGEITQGVFVNFKNVINSTRQEIPFGIAQIGKAFRNEITPGNFTFRSREFEQMELQFYVKPEKGESQKWYEYWKAERMKWYVSLGMDKKKLRFRQHEEGERAHYAKDAWDIEYDSPFGWKEFEGIHNRGDWDLSQHQKHSGVDMGYTDQESGHKFLPYIIETSGGVDRAALFFLINAYFEDKDRVVLKLHKKLAPFKVAIFPLLANKIELVKKARSVHSDLKTQLSELVAWDDRGNIGKRYFAQDEIGTPYCITIDFQTLADDTVTIRDRDSMKQERFKIKNLEKYFKKKFNH